MRDAFVFYRSFAKVFRNLSNNEQKVNFINIVLDYALDDKAPESDGLLETMFELIKPQIDANNRRYDNGKKGGRPKKEDEMTMDEKIDEARRRNRNKTK